MTELMRLQKYIAHQGIASRRKAEEMIRAGKIFVNGEKATIGQKIDPENDKVELFDEHAKAKETDLVYYAFYKPVGVTSTTRKFKGEKNVLSFFPNTHRLQIAGRLDKESRGLMVLTNDGDLVYQLTHPSNKSEKEYFVRADKPIDELCMKRLRQGIRYEGVEYKTISVRRRTKKEIRIILGEGKKRHIRMMFRACGLQVTDLYRNRINELQLGKLKPGQYRQLFENDLKKLVTSRRK